jgi:hypothetical protein
MKDRRMVALRHSERRRQKLDDSLRVTLAEQREAHRAELEQAEVCQHQLDRNAQALEARTQHLQALMDGVAAFSLETLNETRRYIELLEERKRASLAELQRQQVVVDDCAAALARTRQRLAVNQNRLKLVKDRALAIQRELDTVTSDAADDEAQEIAAARIIRARSQAA